MYAFFQVRQANKVTFGSRLTARIASSQLNNY